MTYLETLLQSAQTEAKLLQNKIISLEEEVRTLRETLDHKEKHLPWYGYKHVNLFGTASNEPPRTASGFEYTVEYVKPKPLETKELEVRLQRLAAHLTKRSKENQKRSDKLDRELNSTFLPSKEMVQKHNSTYYLSGKADSYLTAAGKVLELLSKWRANEGG